MKTVEYRCSNCGGNMKIDPNSKSIRCPYCDKEMYLENNNGEDYFEKGKIELEKIELEKLKISRDKQQSILPYMMMVICFIAIFSLIIIFPEDKVDENHAAVTFSSENIQNQNYKKIIQQLKDSGFNNIETIKIEDLVLGLLKSDGEIESITINGIEAFEEGDIFERNAKITVTYHTFSQ